MLTWKKIVKVFLTIICALFSCVPDVYASLEFNQEKWLALIILVGNFGFGLYGYSKIFDQVFTKFFNKTTDNSAVLLRGIKKVLADQSLQLDLLKSNDVEDYLSKLKQLGSRIDSYSQIKQVIQLMMSLIICFAGLVVDIFLTRNFLSTNHILENGVGLACTSLLIALPGLVINFISSQHIIGSLFDICSKHKESEYLFRVVYPKFSYIMTPLILLIAATAPSAAAYISYKTLSLANLPDFLVDFAVAAMICARFVFSNFTLHRIFSSGLLKFVEQFGSAKDQIKIDRVKRIRELDKLVRAILSN